MRGPRPRLSPTGRIDAIVRLGSGLQAMATEHGIHNVFDDGGYKELILLTLFGLKKLSREGDDATDLHGNRYEVKTVARVGSRGAMKRTLSVTTEHTLTRANIDRYRRVQLWIIAVFNQSEPEAIYEIEPSQLEDPYFREWERRILEMERARTASDAPPHINNPKIPLRYIELH
ncbi:MAG: hypothetical protein ACRDZT_09295, partial [Acidimicrobiales bacterium]